MRALDWMFISALMMERKICLDLAIVDIVMLDATVSKKKRPMREEKLSVVLLIDGCSWVEATLASLREKPGPRME